MDNIDTKIDGIIKGIPAWSITIDPNMRLDFDALKSSALSFIEALPDIRERYRFTKQSLKRLEDNGLPKEFVSKLDLLDESKVYDGDELSQILQDMMDERSRGKYDLLIRKQAEIWRARLIEYSSKYCFPKLNKAKASAMYLFFRVIFQLPNDSPIDATKVFGGWIHPSIGVEGNSFNLSWPVIINKDGKFAVVHDFDGYFGKGYDCIGEYDYFFENFPFRSSSSLRSIVFKSLP